jgi:predicted RNA-binding Zn-ribbon protein involved in translation (DUF1610 family)
MTEEPERLGSLKKCPDCGVEMRLTKDVQIRTQGVTGLTRVVFGEWAELLEDFLPVNIYFCPKCEQIRFYKPSTSRNQKQPNR